MQVTGRLVYEFGQQFSDAAQLLGALRFIALRIFRQPDVVGLVSRENEILAAAVGIQKVLKHPEQEIVSVRIGRAELVIAFGIFAKPGILRVFQDERIVRRPVQVRNKLDVILQGLVRELLQFGGRECVRLDDGRRAFVLEVPLQFDGESVKFEKCRLAQCALEVVEVLEIVVDEAAPMAIVDDRLTFRERALVHERRAIRSRRKIIERHVQDGGHAVHVGARE